MDGDRLTIYTHAMRRKHDAAADKMAELPGAYSVWKERGTNDGRA